MRIRSILFTALLGAACVACHHDKPAESSGTAAASGKSLYERLGGKPAITKVVDDFVAIVVADSRINAFFANADAPHLKAMLVDQICDAASGGKECQYKGKNMKEAHASMGVAEKDFNALVEDLKKALDADKVGAQEQQELLGVLGPMKADIVTK